MKYIKKSLLSAFLIVTFPLSAFIIDNPGNYNLGGDLVDTGTDIITIQANNVDLNLGGKLISGGLNGITVKPGFANIRIRNGFISQVSGSGISIGQNCIGVQISDVGIAQCGGRSIEVLGTDASNQVKNVLIDGVTTNACCTSITSSQVVLVQYANNVVMRNSAILLSGNASNDIEVVKIENSQECLFLSVLQKNNVGAALTGYNFDNAKTSFLADIGISTGLALSKSFTGIKLSNESSENGFGFCRVVSCTALAGDATGVEIQSGSHGNAFRDVNIAGLEGEAVYGFCVIGAGTPSNTVNNFVADSNIVNCVARSGNAIGFYVSRADNSAIGRSRFLAQSAPSGTAAGIMFASGTGGNNWTIVDNRMLRNIGSSDATSYGINIVTGTDNIFLINRSTDNGATAANQFAGVPAGAVSLVTPSTINTVSAPWTNIGVTT